MVCSAMAGAVARRWWAAGAAAELPTCVSLLHGAWAASLHPAQGPGLLRLQVPTVLSAVAGARTRRATRPSARVHRSAWIRMTLEPDKIFSHKIFLIVSRSTLRKGEKDQRQEADSEADR